jgi:hypothetical protein
MTIEKVVTIPEDERAILKKANEFISDLIEEGIVTEDTVWDFLETVYYGNPTFENGKIIYK